MILDENLFEAVQTGDVRGSYKKKYQPKLSYNKIYDSLEDLGYHIKASDNSNLESAIMVSKRYEKNLQKAKNYCKEVGLECKQRYSKTQDRYYLDIILPKNLPENFETITEDFEEYKGYNIEHNFYGQNEYTVQYQGDDVWFDNKEEAMKFIDGITSEKNIEESKKSEIKSEIKSAQSEIDCIKTATETAKSHLETIKANKDQYLPDPSDKRYDELLDKYEQLIKGFEETVDAGEKIIHEIKRKSSIKEELAPEKELEYGLTTMINNLIKDELEAVDGYNSAIVTLEAENKGEFTDVIRDIISEENKHIGQLQSILKELNPSTTANIDEGQQEGQEQIDQAVGVTEGDTEETTTTIDTEEGVIKTYKLDKVEDMKESLDNHWYGLVNHSDMTDTSFALISKDKSELEKHWDDLILITEGNPDGDTDEEFIQKVVLPKIKELNNSDIHFVDSDEMFKLSDNRVFSVEDDKYLIGEEPIEIIKKSSNRF